LELSTVSSKNLLRDQTPWLKLKLLLQPLNKLIVHLPAVAAPFLTPLAVKNSRLKTAPANLENLKP
jgi:hypothetical protein